MSNEELIERLRQGALNLAEKNLDLWEQGYLQAYIDLRLELERGGAQGYAKQLQEESK